MNTNDPPTIFTQKDAVAREEAFKRKVLAREELRRKDIHQIPDSLIRETVANLAVSKQRLLELKELHYTQVGRLRAQVRVWDVRAKKAEHLLSSLLAVIHRDGGHYEHAHGTDAAVAQAILVSIRLIDREEDSL